MKTYIFEDKGADYSKEMTETECRELLTATGCTLNTRFASLEGTYVDACGDEIEVSFYDITE